MSKASIPSSPVVIPLEMSEMVPAIGAWASLSWPHSKRIAAIMASNLEDGTELGRRSAKFSSLRATCAVR